MIQNSFIDLYIILLFDCTYYQLNKLIEFIHWICDGCYIEEQKIVLLCNFYLCDKIYIFFFLIVIFIIILIGCFTKGTLNDFFF